MYTLKEIKEKIQDNNSTSIIDFTVRKASILIPLVQENGKIYILLTRRSEEVHSHKKQISFPGGRHEKKDENLLETMFREVEEEIGVPRSEIDLFGRLDDFLTGTGYLIRPFIGLIKTQNFVLQKAEVENLIKIELSYFFDESKHFTSFTDYREHAFKIHLYTYETEVIWGITGGIIHELVSTLKTEKN